MESEQDYKFSGKLNSDSFFRAHQNYYSNPPDLMITRIMFLKKFTEEIINNLSKEYESKINIEIEKIKRKFISTPRENPEEFKKIINHKILYPYKYQKNGKKNRKLPPVKRPIATRTPIKDISNDNVPSPRDIDYRKFQVLESIKPEYKQKPEGFSLGKIEPLLKDNLIQTIECPGPGKNILVKKFNKINVTKLILSQEEINAIVTQFSNAAKIPLLGGILKAAVGNILISAVTSDFAGSRFIINRINPNVNLY